MSSSRFGTSFRSGTSRRSSDRLAAVGLQPLAQVLDRAARQLRLALSVCGLERLAIVSRIATICSWLRCRPFDADGVDARVPV